MSTADPVASKTRLSLQDALAASESRFRLLVQNSPDGIIVSNHKGRILYANPEAALMFGRSAENLTGKCFGYPISTGKSTEIEVLRLDKKPKVAQMRVAEIEWEGESAFMCSIRDLSSRVRLMEDLKRSNEDLNKFAEAISQNIRMPLHNIGSLASWLKENNTATMNADASEDLQLMVDQAAYAQNMIEDLLKYNQLSAHQKQSADVNLQDALNEAIESLSSDIFRSGAEIESCQLPKLNCNYAQMVTLFENLISNAINYCDGKPRVIIDCEKKPDSWTLSIKDNGIGIDNKNWQNVFLPFNQLQKKKGRNSTGIGLATCQKIIEQHSGQIWFESSVTTGTTVFIQMPVDNDSTFT